MSENSIDTAYLDEQTRANLGLVHSLAHRFTGKGIEYEDMFQAGCMGLVKAIKAFDKSRGFSFSTYAVPVILGEIRRLFRDGGAVKVSRSVKELGLKCLRTREQLEKALGRQPHISEIAEALGEDAVAVAEALTASLPVISLTANDNDDADRQIDIPIDSMEEKIAENISLTEQLAKLAPRDRQIIYYRYYKDMTQSKTAELLGLTQVQVSRCEKRILSSLRENLS